MNAFPLTPFLAALAAEGIVVTLRDYDRISLALRAEGAWTAVRLRSVLMALLVRDAERGVVFLRCFDAFFDVYLDTEARFSQVDVDRALADLRQLAQGPAPLDEELRRPPRRIVRALETPLQPHSKRFWIALAVVTALALGAAVGGYVWFKPEETKPSNGVVVSTNGPSHCPPQAVPNNPAWQKTKTYTIPIERPEDYNPFLLAAAGLLLLTLGYGYYLWRSRRLPQDPPAHWLPDSPRRFRLGAIGGDMAPRLDAEALDQLADALGYFQSERPSEMLDVAASIEATSHNGGMPRLVFQPRQAMRTVLVLEDVEAEAGAWNPIARELAVGLQRRGVPVLYGEFRGAPLHFRTSDGAKMHLEDLDDDRQGYLLLVFSDGKGVQPHRDALTLETLARWPMAAWLELRDSQFWDESAALPARYGLPLYAATPEGLSQAMARFVAEGVVLHDVSAVLEDGRSLPVYTNAQLDVYIEDLLGDALPWAQACAMVQPLSFGMADALRRAFDAALPPQRLDRLVALPGTVRTEAGLYFDTPVLAVLRRGFAVRWEADRQEAVLRFMIERIDEAEPPEPDSWAHLTWEWMRERVHLELEPDAALQRLSALAQTRLGDAMRAALDICVLPEEASSEGDAVPLRRRPRTRDGLQRLARLASRSGVPMLEAYPVAWWQRAVGVLLVVACLGCGAWGAVRYRAAQIRVGTLPQMTFVLIPAGTFLMGTPAERVDALAKQYRPEREWFESETPQHGVKISRPFYLGEVEVTQAQWQAVMGDNPGAFKGDDKPVTMVSWENVQEFIQRLNELEGRDTYRLPTEAEWEYAARACATTEFSFGDDPSQLKDYAWHAGNSNDVTHPVGQKKPNRWGLYDMSGNAWEWVHDWFDGTYYQKSPRENPQGPQLGANRVYRGGCSFNFTECCRVAYRGYDHPGARVDLLGFRLLRTAP